MDALARRVATQVADELMTKLGLAPGQPPTTAAPGIRRKLNVDEFAFVAQHAPAVIRRKIRGKVIPEELVSGPPYLIHPNALKKFAVTPEIATQRLQEYESLHPKEAPAAPAQIQSEAGLPCPA